MTTLKSTDFDPFNDVYLEEPTDGLPHYADTQHTIAEPVKSEQPAQTFPERKPFYTEGVLMPYIDQMCDHHGRDAGITRYSSPTERRSFIEYLCERNRYIREAVHSLRLQSAYELAVHA